MSIVTDALGEVRAAQAIAAGVCPIVLERFNHQYIADTTAFCAVCPDGGRVPRGCPELAPHEDERGTTCILYSGTGRHNDTPQGKCRYAQPDAGRRCTCFTVKGAEWWRAYNAWLERRQREDDQDARIRENAVLTRRLWRAVGMTPDAAAMGRADSQVLG